MKRFYLLAVMLLVFACAARADTILWYNGDFDGRNGLANEINTLVPDSRVYDDFIVPSGGWTIGTVWSNDLSSIRASSAYWEIRSGVSAGNGGTLVASGTSSATQTLTGRSAFGFSEYTIEVSGLNIPLATGTYWLTVAPIDSGLGRSFVSTTSGLNAVGNPPGNDGLSFFDSTFFGTNFELASDEPGQPNPADYSMGVGTSGAPAVPEPCTLALFGLGAFGLLRRRSRKN